MPVEPTLRLGPNGPEHDTAKKGSGILIWILLGLLALYAIGSQLGNDKGSEERQSSISEACADAFATAAGVSEYQDTHEDLFPAYSACSSIKEWKAANAMYPDAIDGVDPVIYAKTVCTNNRRELGHTSICQVVNLSSPEDDVDLGQINESVPSASPSGRRIRVSRQGEGAQTNRYLILDGTRRIVETVDCWELPIDQPALLDEENKVIWFYPDSEYPESCRIAAIRSN